LFPWLAGVEKIPAYSPHAGESPVVIVIVNSSFLERPTKAKSREPAYSQAHNQNKIDRQRSKSRESGKQTGRRQK